MSRGLDARDMLELWDDTVQRGCDDVAILDGGNRLTFAETDQSTSALAAQLARRGVGPEVLVGIDVRRPAGAVTALIAVLKAGGAALLLDDPRLTPRAAAPAVVLVDEPQAPGHVSVHDVAPASWDWRAGLASADQLAYVCCTSGSTGGPKGVMISRRSLAAFTEAVVDRLGLTPADCWLQVASPGFDVFIEEVVPALAAGATVACRDWRTPLDPRGLHQALDQAQATVVELSTQYWYEYEHWLAVNGLQPPPSLRLVVVGGEHMDPARYRRWQQRCRVALVHVYGITETTVSSTMFTGPVDDDRARFVPVGPPLAHNDVQLRAAEDGGQTGEIVITGDAVGRGYLGQPGLTADRFRPDPAGPPGRRAYLTGDLGSWVDGGLVCRGRDDGQMKVLGYRVEAGAVEAALRAVPGVSQAAVALDEPGRRTLSAFLVADAADRLVGEGPVEAGADDRAAIAHVLERSLPPWSRPTRYFWVARLPTNQHDKVDRAALARLSSASAPASRGSAGPTEPAEHHAVAACVAAFRVALGQPDVGPDDDFFEFGGDSLRALTAMSELRDAGWPVGDTAAVLFDAATPRRLADHLLLQPTTTGTP